MRWERFFQDLEDQLAAQWDAERAALESESERLRLAGLELRDRLRALAGGPVLALELADGTRHDAAVVAVGADWVAARPGRAGVLIVPLAAVRAIGAPEPELLRSARAGQEHDRLSARITLGFALRDLARRRVPATLGLRGGRTVTGTVDRVGSDHLDLALHDLDAPRRPGEVAGFRILPLASLAWVRVGADARPMLT